MDLSIVPVSAETWPDLEDLFGKGGASNGCWCMWPRLGPAYWRRPHEENRCELQHLVETIPSPGLLAFDGALCVGWCQVAPRSDLAWINQRSLYGPPDESSVWAIPCFFVRRSHRRRGVTASLIAAAIDHARANGAQAIEAYPVDTAVDGHTRNLFPGVAAAFAPFGFTEVLRKKRDRPVLRKFLV